MRALATHAFAARHRGDACPRRKALGVGAATAFNRAVAPLSGVPGNSQAAPDGPANRRPGEPQRGCPRHAEWERRRLYRQSGDEDQRLGPRHVGHTRLYFGRPLWNGRRFRERTRWGRRSHRLRWIAGFSFPAAAPSWAEAAAAWAAAAPSAPAAAAPTTASSSATAASSAASASASASATATATAAPTSAASSAAATPQAAAAATPQAAASASGAPGRLETR